MQIADANPLSRLSDAYRKYRDQAPQTHHVTIAESEELARDLAVMIGDFGEPVDLIVGLANGAFLPAKVTADTLGVPWEMVKVRRKGTRYKQKLLGIKNALRIPPELILWGPFRAMWVFFQERTSALEASDDAFDFDVAGKAVFIVDDCIETGSSLRYVKGMLLQAGAKSVNTAVYCWADMPKIDPVVSKPDIYLHRGTQFYPWSNNSRYLSDFYKWMTDHGLTLWQ